MGTIRLVAVVVVLALPPACGGGGLAEPDDEDEGVARATLPGEAIDPGDANVPIPHAVVERMVQLAEVGEDDVVHDLGSEGAVSAVAEQYGARAVTVDSPAQADLAGATVVSLYLSAEQNLELRPRLLELEAGTRIVSNGHDLGDWEADEVELVEADGTLWTLLLWRVPG